MRSGTNLHMRKTSDNWTCFKQEQTTKYQGLVLKAQDRKGGMAGARRQSYPKPASFLKKGGGTLAGCNNVPYKVDGR
jgi:hypothetical protein